MEGLENIHLVNTEETIEQQRLREAKKKQKQALLNRISNESLEIEKRKEKLESDLLKAKQNKSEENFLTDDIELNENTDIDISDNSIDLTNTSQNELVINSNTMENIVNKVLENDNNQVNPIEHIEYNLVITEKEPNKQGIVYPENKVDIIYQPYQDKNTFHEYSPQTSYGNSLTFNEVNYNNKKAEFDKSNLDPNTTYHYRIKNVEPLEVENLNHVVKNNSQWQEIQKEINSIDEVDKRSLKSLSDVELYFNENTEEYEFTTIDRSENINIPNSNNNTIDWKATIDQMSLGFKLDEPNKTMFNKFVDSIKKMFDYLKPLEFTENKTVVEIEKVKTSVVDDLRVNKITLDPEIKPKINTSDVSWLTYNLPDNKFLLVEYYRKESKVLRTEILNSQLEVNNFFINLR